MFGSDKSKGSVLLMTLMFMICLTILSSLFLNMVMVNSTNASALVNSTQALYLAEAGVNKAVYYLKNTAPDGTTNASWRTTAYPAVAGNYAPSGTLPASCTLTPTQPCQESLDGGLSSYTIWVVTAGNKIQITSSGAYNGLIRTVQEEFTQLSAGIGLSLVYGTRQEI
jgi:Tfp pilus assembly protein PilX